MLPSILYRILDLQPFLKTSHSKTFSFLGFHLTGSEDPERCATLGFGDSGGSEEYVIPCIQDTFQLLYVSVLLVFNQIQLSPLRTPSIVRKSR